MTNGGCFGRGGLGGREARGGGEGGWGLCLIGERRGGVGG